VKLDLGTLQAFSAALLALADVARSAPPERMINDALLALRPLVPFRSAWWGECSNTDAQDMPRNWLHGRINLSACPAACGPRSSIVMTPTPVYSRPCVPEWQECEE